MRFQPTRQSTRQVSCPVINSNQLTVPCVGSVKQGDSVMIITRNGEPVAVAPIGWGDAVESDISDAATKATSYITDIDSGGVTVHPSDDSTTGVQITEDVDILRSGTSVINIGTNDAVRVGVEASKHVDITEGGIELYDGDTQVGGFSDGLIEIGAEPSSVGTSSTVSMTGGSFLITSIINPLGGGRTTSMEVVSDSGREQYLEIVDGLSHVHLNSLGNDELGAARVSCVVDAIDEASTAYVSCASDGTASEVTIGGDSVEVVGPTTISSINGLYARATGTSSATNYFTLINADTGVGVQFIFNPSTLNLVARYTTNGGTNWSSTKTIASWS